MIRPLDQEHTEEQALDPDTPTPASSPRRAPDSDPAPTPVSGQAIGDSDPEDDPGSADSGQEMDSSTKRRLLLGFLSNWISKISATVVQLVQVPVFLHFWSVPLYGEWLFVTSIPTYLQFSSIGFGSVAGNEMTILVAAEDRQGALQVFQSCWWLIAILCGGAGFLAAVALFLLPIAKILHIAQISNTDSRWIILYLGISVLLSQLEQLLQSAYRCIGRYPFGSFVGSMLTLGAFIAMIITVALGAGPRRTALVLALANIAGTFLLSFLVHRDIPWIEFGWNHARLATIRRLASPAISFMAFPIGNALNLQGSLAGVAYALGPTNLVIFSTARTVSRVAVQLVQLVNNTFWPEFSIAWGARNYPVIRSLHRRSCQLALVIGLGVVFIMMTLGPWFLNHWTGGHVPPSRGLLSILLVGVIFYALWSTSSTLATATNQHQRLAAWYLFATSVTCAAVFFSARRYGLYGAAAALLISELIMNIYVVPASLRIARDTFPAFASSMLHYPHALRPISLLRRLQRSRPGLES